MLSFIIEKQNRDQDEDELLTDNELGIAEPMNECIGMGVGVSSMGKAGQ
jgi:hypothetical protein